MLWGRREEIIDLFNFSGVTQRVSSLVKAPIRGFLIVWSNVELQKNMRETFLDLNFVVAYIDE